MHSGSDLRNPPQVGCGRAPARGGVLVRRPLVVLDALAVRPRMTGVGRAVIDWTRALAAEQRFCDFVVLCTYPELFDHLTKRSDWRLAVCPGARGGGLRKALWTQVVMPRLLRRFNADILHCLQFVAPLRSPCPVVVTVHDLGYLHDPHATEQPRLSYYRWIVPRSLSRARAVACVSEATVGEVRSLFPSVADRLWLTPQGVPTWVAQHPEPPEARGPQAPFLFVGTLEPRKNIERLLGAYRAFREVRRRLGKPCPRLVIVGPRGWRDRSLRRLLSSLTAQDGVVVEGYCDQEGLWRLYGLARALLFPSLHEGFGFPILEAMAAGTPVMTSNRGAMAEVAGDAALLVDPLDLAALADAMHRLVDDAELVRNLVMRGRANLARWPWSRTADSACHLYRRILAGSVHGSPVGQRGPRRR